MSSKNSPMTIGPNKLTKKLSLGTAQFGLNYGIGNRAGKVEYNEVKSIIKSAQSSGVKWLDTAMGYGVSEKVLGAIGVKEWQITTKLPAVPPTCKDVAHWCNWRLNDSFKNLGVEAVYGLLLHQPDQIFSSFGPDLISFLRDARVQGRVKKIGVSIYSPEEISPLLDFFDFEIVQAPISIADRRLLNSGTFKELKANGIELHARSVFLQGLLLMHADKRPDSFSRWKPFFLEWDRWISQQRLSPLEACLSFIAFIDDVDRIIIGVDSGLQLKEVLFLQLTALASLPQWPTIVDTKLIDPREWAQS